MHSDLAEKFQRESKYLAWLKFQRTRREMMKSRKVAERLATAEQVPLGGPLTHDTCEVFGLEFTCAEHRAITALNFLLNKTSHTGNITSNITADPKRKLKEPVP